MYHVHDAASLFESTRYGAYDRDSIDLLLDSVKSFSDKELFPYIKEMDEKPSRFHDGRILIHPQFERILRQGTELGLVASFFDEDVGGLQLPNIVYNALYYIMEAANNHATGYMALTCGAANLIVAFGSEELKSTYVPKMIDMTWTGTMCLTEPQAGSSLSDIKTTATPNEDGSYTIKGQKIFISAGDHQFAENIVHLVLARIDGAPAGIKGVSLFVVPQRRLQADGSLVSNHVTTVGEFDKLGQRGYCTSHLAFDDDCRGWLVGEAHKGLSYMFQMMNEARIATGRMGAGIASAAYYASLRYANERPQGRNPDATGQKNAAEEQTLIINHPDVRRMLLHQKAIVEGSLSLIMQASQYADKHLISEGEERERKRFLLELLTPVAKTYPAEKGLQAVSTGLQVLGGYGFCTDFILQQYYRDIRIVSIYEGTTGIQSIDLVGRKIGLKGGAVLQWLGAEMQTTIAAASDHDELRRYADTLLQNLGLVQSVVEAMMPMAMKGEHQRFLADATVFMDLFGTIVIGWQWLKIAVAAKQAIASGDSTYPASFYRSKVHTMKFFYTYEMSRTRGLAEAITDELALTVDMDPEFLD